MMCDVTHEWVTWLMKEWHDSWMCDMTHGCVTWLMNVWRASWMCDVPHGCVTWLMNVWHDSWMSDMTHECVTWLMNVWRASWMCDVTHECVTWLMNVWRDAGKLANTKAHVIHTCVCHVSHINVSCHTCIFASHLSLSRSIFLAHVAHILLSYPTHVFLHPIFHTHTCISAPNFFISSHLFMFRFNCICTPFVFVSSSWDGLATISRLPKFARLFCKRAPQK